MSNQPQWLYRKFNVSRTDSRDQLDGDRAGAEYFVLDLTYDQFSIAALLAYAVACQHEYPVLSQELTDRAFAPVPVVRDADGGFYHPVTNAWVEDEYINIAKWLGKYGYEHNIVDFELDAPDDVSDRYFEDGEGYADWTPTPPTGEGWFLLSISNTDDSPCALFIRKKQEEPTA